MPKYIYRHDSTYQEMLRTILTEGEGHDDRTGVGTCSMFGYQTRYNLNDGFPLITTKKMAWKSMVNELVWFLSGRTDNQWLNEHKVTIWDEWATEAQCAKFGRAAGDLGPVYGHQWRRFGEERDEHRTWRQGVDQLANLSKDLLNNPGSRRLIVTGWDPHTCTKVALPPCHTLWQCKVRKDPTGKTRGILDLQLYQRSADAFLGVPFNIASYALLTHLLAHTHGFTPGVFIHTFGDLHVYNNHRTQVAELLSRSPLMSPTIAINDKLRDGGLDALLAFTIEDVSLIGYESHPAIKAEVAV
jgi:thymidylate synthase